MAPRKPPFGGGPKRLEGDPTADLWGTVRRSPDGVMLALLWPSDPHPARWMVSDGQSLGYERPERIAHWPVIGAVPAQPADALQHGGVAAGAFARGEIERAVRELEDKPRHHETSLHRTVREARGDRRQIHRPFLSRPARANLSTVPNGSSIS